MEKDKYVEKAAMLRNDPDVHYNCTQSVLMAFSEECGISDDQARRTGSNMGGGMRMGLTCGALTGALIVLGLLGKDDSETVREFAEDFKKSFGSLECRELLAANKAKGGDKKAHCDELVCKVTESLEKYL